MSIDETSLPLPAVTSLMLCNYDEVLRQSRIEYKNYISTRNRGLLEESENNCLKAIKAVYKTEHYLQIAQAFKHLGDITFAKHLENKNSSFLIQASALYNYSLNLYRLIQISPPGHSGNTSDLGDFKKIINDKLSEVEKNLIENLLSQKHYDDAVSNSLCHFHLNDNYKIELKKIEDNARNNLRDTDIRYPWESIVGPNKKEEPLKTELERAHAIHKIYQIIADDFKHLIEMMLKDCISIMGKAPCNYAIIGLGSLAREEMTPFSDLEWAILINSDTEANKSFFLKLALFFQLKVVNLGKTILPALGISALNNYESNVPDENWFFDDITPRGFAFDGVMNHASMTPVNNSNFINTPIQLSKFVVLNHDSSCTLDINSFKLPLSLVNPTFVSGDISLFNLYVQYVQKELNKINDQSLESHRTILAENQLISCLDAYYLELLGFENEGRQFNVKNELYRLVDRIVDALFIAHSSCNTDDLIKIGSSSVEKMNFLLKKEIVNQNGYRNLRIVIGLTTYLRLRTYLFYGKQKEELPIYRLEKNIPGLSKEPAFNRKLIESMITRYFFTTLPLSDFLKSSISAEKKLINSIYNQNDFFDDSAYTRAKIAARMFSYNESIEALKLEVENRWEKYESKNMTDAFFLFDLARDMNFLSKCYFKLGHYKLQEKFLKRSCQIFDDKQFIIALKKGAPEKAAHQIRSVFEKNLTVNSFNLGVSLLKQGKYLESENNLKLALNRYTDLYGDFHISVVETLEMLGALYLTQDGHIPSVENRYLAKEYILKAKHICLNLEETPQIKTKLMLIDHKIGAIELYDGNFTESRQILSKCHKFFFEKFGQYHIYTITLCIDSIPEMVDMSKIDQVKEMLNDSMRDISELFKNNEHPDLIAPMRKLVNHLIQHGEFDQAIELSKKCKEISEKYFGIDHGETYLVTADLLRALTRKGNASLKNMELTSPVQIRAQGGNLLYYFEIREPLYKDAINLYDSIYNMTLKGVLRSSMFDVCGQSAYNNRKYNEAIEHYTMACRLTPNNKNLSDKLKKIKNEINITGNNESDVNIQYNLQEPISNQQVLLSLNHVIVKNIDLNPQFIGYFRNGKEDYILDALYKISDDVYPLSSLLVCLKNQEVPYEVIKSDKNKYVVIKDVNGETADLISRICHNTLQKRRALEQLPECSSAGAPYTRGYSLG